MLDWFCLFVCGFFDDSFLRQVSGSKKKDIFPLTEWLSRNQPNSWCSFIFLCAWGCVLRGELCAAVTPECCHGVLWDLVTGLRALWFLARELLKLVVTGCQLLLWEELPGFPGCHANCLALHCSVRVPLQSSHSCPATDCPSSSAAPPEQCQLSMSLCRVLISGCNFLSFLFSLDPL